MSGDDVAQSTKGADRVELEGAISAKKAAPARVVARRGKT